MGWMDGYIFTVSTQQHIIQHKSTQHNTAHTTSNISHPKTTSAKKRNKKTGPDQPQTQKLNSFYSRTPPD